MDKKSLRTVARARLGSLSVEEITRSGAHIEEKVWAIPEIASARAILLYASMGAEVPTDAIAVEARQRGIEVVYPRCLPENRLLSLHSVEAAGDLRFQGAYGIREPAPDCPVIEIEQIDVAFIPGLAWDRAGGRLGRGAGYFDRLLGEPSWKAIRCGLFYAVQEVPALPRDPWDQPLDLVITERETVRIGDW